MFVHKQLDLVTIAEPSPLRDQIHKSTTDANLVAIMEKDRPLIEAALATDKRVVSLDDKVRKQFRNHVHRLPEIRDVCWVNPSKADEKAVAWLESGAPADRDRLLGSPIAK